VDDFLFNLQLVALGVSNGAFYALLSLGLAVIFGMLNVINFAHGAQFMMGAFAAWLLLAYLGIGYWAALVLAPLIVGAIGIVMERLMISRLYKLDHLYGLLLTFGCALVIEGLFRKPTVVNNIETMACVSQIARRGVDWFKSIGVPADPANPRDPGSYGPKLYCLSGHVEKPGCYEAPLGITARELIDRFGGGVWKGRKAKAVIPGGISMGLMTESELDTPLDFAGPGKVGCLGLGTAAVVVIDDQTSIVDFLHNSARFFAHESCGQCTPCREGTSWSLRILERIKAGKGRLKDLDILLELGNTMGMMPGSTICGLADGAAWPMKNAIKKFRGEFEDYIKRTNPSGWMVTDPVPALQIVGAH
jgi:NADH-quinone oxidoreductase subunit F